MIYVTGDMHGDESRLYDSQWRKLKAGDVVIICGDFCGMEQSKNNRLSNGLAQENTQFALLTALTKILK